MSFPREHHPSATIEFCVFLILLIGTALMIVVGLLGTAHAQQPMQKQTITYNLTPEQALTMKRAFVAADFWFGVRSQAEPNTFEGRGFEIQRAELGQLAQELGRQEQAAAAGAAKAAEPAPMGSAPASDQPAQKP